MMKKKVLILYTVCIVATYVKTETHNLYYIENPILNKTVLYLFIHELNLSSLFKIMILKLNHLTFAEHYCGPSVGQNFPYIQNNCDFHKCVLTFAS